MCTIPRRPSGQTLELILLIVYADKNNKKRGLFWKTTITSRASKPLITLKRSTHNAAEARRPEGLPDLLSKRT